MFDSVADCGIIVVKPFADVSLLMKIIQTMKKVLKNTKQSILKAAQKCRKPIKVEFHFEYIYCDGSD